MSAKLCTTCDACEKTRNTYYCTRVLDPVTGEHMMAYAARSDTLPTPAGGTWTDLCGFAGKNWIAKQ